MPGRAPQGRREVWRQTVIGACLLAPYGALLVVPLYAGETPRIFGVPLFYWYQFAWVVLTPALMVVAYVLLRRGPSEQAQVKR
ncbi:MAG: DUF3311 domain-containing protein [Pseudonocardiaceae bacterium]